MDELSQRERSILDILIGTYIVTGEPVGSRTVSRIGLGLSAATIRNSMADLEEKGYLMHPHTSAGRVPTDKGYRYYVDDLMSQEELAQVVREQIRKRIEAHIREGNVQALLEQVSKVIADVSHNLGMALAPTFEQGTFRRLEMVLLSESKLLLVLTIESGLVKTMVMEIDSAIRAKDLDDTRRVVNERLSGLTIREIRDSVEDRLRSLSQVSPKLLRLICHSADSLFQFNDGGDLHFGVARNFFLQPEFSSDQEMLASLFDLLEERESIVTMLNDRADNEGITITIGNEHTSPELQHCSLLTSRYRVGNTSGVIGVIGPKRMPYARVVPLVQYVAGLTEAILEKP